MVSRSAAKKERQSSSAEEEGDSARAPPLVEDEGDQQVKTEEERAAKEAYHELCRELNMDSATCDAAWKSYEAIRTNYTLEVSFLDTVPTRLVQLDVY